jgi:NADH:ubiquinone oxidoreductase subunit E
MNAMSVKPAACKCGDPTDQQLQARLDAVLAQYRDKPGGLIPVLQLAQAIYGYLPKDVIKKIALGLNKSYSEVAGVVGFYSFFSTKPRGRHLVRVCMGTACYVRGGGALVEAFKAKLGVDVGETTKDKEFTLEVARCFGACGLAPVITVDDDVHHRVKANKVDDILAQYRGFPAGKAENGNGNGAAQPAGAAEEK